MTDKPPTRRHPSAGNLNSRPSVVREGEAPPGLPIGSFPHGADLVPDALHLGPDLDDAALTKLAGEVAGKRILDLGCGTGAASVFFATHGAKVIAVDANPDRLGRARENAEQAEIHFELHQSDLAELAFIRADSIDLVVSVFALSEVSDLNRVFRQVHRILRPEAPFLLSLPHPAGALVESGEAGPVLKGDYFARKTRPWRAGGAEGSTHPHTIADVFTALTRTSFRVDTLLEPEPPARGPRSSHWHAHHATLPSTLVIRARKLGI